LSFAWSSPAASPQANLEDESASSGDASIANAARDRDASEGSLSTPSIERACGKPVQRFGADVEYHTTLESLCAALAATPGLRCPANRRELAESLIDACGPGRDFPLLERRCGYDSFRVFNEHYNSRATWVFDSATGALVGANVYGDEGLPCGDGNYLSGPDWKTCRSPGLSPDLGCELCEGGPGRDESCPPDVVAVLPSTPCGAPVAGPRCACSELASDNGPFDDLPEQGMACGPAGTCQTCGGEGTCFADCVCARDGVFRWKRLCTE
jgi:hypothetical protein